MRDYGESFQMLFSPFNSFGCCFLPHWVGIWVEKLLCYTDLVFQLDRLPLSCLNLEHTLWGFMTMFEIHSSWTTKWSLSMGLLNFCKLWKVPVLYDKLQMSLFPGSPYQHRAVVDPTGTVSLVPSLAFQHFKTGKLCLVPWRKVSASPIGSSYQQRQS